MALNRKILRSFISYVPLLNTIISKKGTGGSNSGEYCFEMWKMHKHQVLENGGNNFSVVAVIGPGDSIGSGLCALIEGTQKYLALDSINHIDSLAERKIFQEIKNIYQKESPKKHYN